MGLCGTKEANKQILLCGLDGAGKTTLLYSEYGMHFSEFTTEASLGKQMISHLVLLTHFLGYNFETVDIKDRKIGIFDIGGQESVTLKEMI